MIKRLLRSIRQKPKSSRDNIAFVLAAFFTALVFTGWLYQTPARYAAIEDKRGSVSEQDSAPGFSDFFSDIGKQIASLKDSVATVSKDTDEEIDQNLDNSGEIFISPAENPAGFSAKASTTDKYTWPSEDVDEEVYPPTEPVVSQEPAEREVLIIATDKSSTTPNEE